MLGVRSVWRPLWQGQDFRSNIADWWRGCLVCVYMDGSPYCIVACAHLGNSTGHRTATMVAPLVTTGPARYEAVLHSCGTSPVGGEGVGTKL